MTFEKRRGKSLVWSPFNKDVGLENCFFFKIYQIQSPEHLHDKIPQSICQYRTSNAHNTPNINAKHLHFKNSYFQSTMIHFNKLYSDNWNSKKLTFLNQKFLNS